MLINERDQFSNYYNGYDIDWHDWANYLPQFTCRCAKAAIDKGYKYFGLQFWGECWSGPTLSAEIEYYKYGEGDACYGTEYNLCHDGDVNCVGASSHNFIYEIETYECEVHFEKMSCYNDYSWTARHGNQLVLTARHKSTTKPESFYGQYIDWFNFDIFLPKFACECAKKVVEAGHNTFGMQFYGECWTGPQFDEEKYYIAQGESNSCVNSCHKECKLWDPFCIGGSYANMIYRITHPECEMKYKNLGCYNAFDEIGRNPAISELLFNEISPTIYKFNGHMLKFNDTWETQYSQLLCRCARVAEEKGYEVFAIRNKGECWSGASSRQTYGQYGESGSCVRKESDICEDNTLCAGDENSINVYEILGRNILLGK